MAAVTASSDAVIGHYMQQGSTWSPAPAQSSQLFQSIVSDDQRAVEDELQRDSSRLNAFWILLHWPSHVTEQDRTDKESEGTSPVSNASVTVKQRTLLMLAAYHGSLRVLSCLLSKGAEPSLKSPDALTAYDFAVMGGQPNANTVLAMLKDAEGNFTLSSNTSQFDPVVSAPQVPRPIMPGSNGNGYPLALEHPINAQAIQGVPGGQDYEIDMFNPDSLPYSTAELTRPEYATDTFRMFCFKVLRCSKRYAHDWRACPFAHPTENARRRDPREFKYCSTACPEYKQGFCIRGDTCPYAHGVFESWLHPSRYRTQLCKDGLQCRRPVCFFAHSLAELRQPTYNYTPTHESTEGLKPVKSPMGSFNDRTEFQPDSPLDPAVSSNASQQSLLDMANASLSIDLMSRLKTSSPETTTANSHLVNKMMALDTSSVGSASLIGSPVPGSPTDSVLSMSAGGFIPSVAAPRMSNAFARKHGLNPRDNPVVNLQKIALAGQLQVVPTVVPHNDHSKVNRGRKFVQQPHPQQQHQQPFFEQHHHFLQQQPFAQPDPTHLAMFGHQQLAVGAGHIHPVWQ